MLVSLATLKQKVRWRADMVNSQFISDAELTDYINSAARALSDLLISANQDYELTTVDFTIASGNTYTLPSNFYKLRGVDFHHDGRYCPVRQFNFLERGKLTDSAHFYRIAPVKYQILGSTLTFLPAESAPGNYRLYYVPEMTALAADADTINVQNGWDEFIALKGAQLCLQKEESDTREIDKLLGDETLRITAMSSERDYGDTERIVDVKSGRDYDSWEDEC